MQELSASDTVREHNIYVSRHIYILICVYFYPICMCKAGLHTNFLWRGRKFRVEHAKIFTLLKIHIPRSSFSTTMLCTVTEISVILLYLQELHAFLIKFVHSGGIPVCPPPVYIPARGKAIGSVRLSAQKSPDLEI